MNTISAFGCCCFTTVDYSNAGDRKLDAVSECRMNPAPPRQTPPAKEAFERNPDPGEFAQVRHPIYLKNLPTTATVPAKVQSHPKRRQAFRVANCCKGPPSPRIFLFKKSHTFRKCSNLSSDACGVFPCASVVSHKRSNSTQLVSNSLPSGLCHQTSVSQSSFPL